MKDASPKLMYESIVLMPFLEDEASLSVLMGELCETSIPFHVVVVDDGSNVLPLKSNFFEQFNVSYTLISLVRNTGPQRAISVGIHYIKHHFNFQRLVVMDSDGEDSPGNLPSLLGMSEGLGRDYDVIVVSRLSRHNSLRFKVLYNCYKALFRFLTGKSMDFGHFCVLSNEAVNRLVHYPQLWLHLGSTFYISRLRMFVIALPRNKRNFGNSKLSLVSLVNHGLRSLVALSERVIPRVLIGAVVNVLLVAALTILAAVSKVSLLLPLSLLILAVLIILMVNLIMKLSVSEDSLVKAQGTYFDLIKSIASG